MEEAYIGGGDPMPEQLDDYGMLAL